MPFEYNLHFEILKVVNVNISSERPSSYRHSISKERQARDRLMTLNILHCFSLSNIKKLNLGIKPSRAQQQLIRRRERNTIAGLGVPTLIKRMVNLLSDHIKHNDHSLIPTRSKQILLEIAELTSLQPKI